MEMMKRGRTAGSVRWAHNPEVRGSRGDADGLLPLPPEESSPLAGSPVNPLPATIRKMFVKAEKLEKIGKFIAILMLILILSIFIGYFSATSMPIDNHIPESFPILGGN